MYGRDFIYQGDGASIHIGQYAKWYNKEAMVKGFDSWPPNSPDLNPIEHIWGYLKLRVNKHSIHTSNIDQLEAIVRDEWFKISNIFFRPWLLQCPKDAKLSDNLVGGGVGILSSIVVGLLVE
ncbi:hypothetical protein G6F56_010709 [Rhizopus delemar]|nr:hypothetical protein G6F56_010709 [Rhizopus delemar]